MIISASRRTDIPAFYSDWFFNRVREGYAMSRNPMNYNQTRRIELSPQAVDGIVFWTKNPALMLERLCELREYTYYFQFTLTPYGSDIEAGLPDKAGVLIPAFLRLAREIGPDRIVWRYDPILINSKYTAEYHIAAFSRMACALEGATSRVTISFLDTSYREVRRNIESLAPLELSSGAKLRLAASLADIAREHKMEMSACATPLDLSPAGITPARCVDAALLERLSGRSLRARPHKGQRALCGCSESVDIGVYNTCMNGCRYCYANYNSGAARLNLARHDPRSPFLAGG